jgi:hypothetical protein
MEAEVIRKRGGDEHREEYPQIAPIFTDSLSDRPGQSVESVQSVDHLSSWCPGGESE